MSTGNHAALALAKGRGYKTTHEKGVLANIQSSLVDCAKAICPGKTWAYLDALMGIGEDTAKHRLSGRRKFTADELATLLRTERGIDYLIAVMGEAEPAWWRRFKKHLKVEHAVRMQRAARRLLEEAVDADRELSAAIGRAEAAMAFSDPDFHRPQLEAMAEARTSHRPVAPSSKRGGEP